MCRIVKHRPLVVFDIKPVWLVLPTELSWTKIFFACRRQPKENFNFRSAFTSLHSQRYLLNIFKWNYKISDFHLVALNVASLKNKLLLLLTFWRVRTNYCCPSASNICAHKRILKWKAMFLKWKDLFCLLILYYRCLRFLKDSCCVFCLAAGKQRRRCSHGIFASLWEMKSTNWTAGLVWRSHILWIELAQSTKVSKIISMGFLRQELSKPERIRLVIFSIENVTVRKVWFIFWNYTFIISLIVVTYLFPP